MIKVIILEPRCNNPLSVISDDLKEVSGACAGCICEAM